MLVILKVKTFYGGSRLICSVEHFFKKRICSYGTKYSLENLKYETISPPKIFMKKNQAFITEQCKLQLCRRIALVKKLLNLEVFLQTIFNSNT